MRQLTTFVFIPLISALLATPAIAQSAAPQRSPEITLQALQQNQNTDPQAWRLAAVEAREAGKLEIASEAIERAAALGLAPVAVGLERARQSVAATDPDAAIAALQILADNGFSAVAVISNDPVLATLNGQPAYDALLAEMSAAAFPCDHQPRFRNFDFWVGEWDVHLENGTLAGSNRIKVAEKGCVLNENWTGASGGTGQSINYLDGETGEWVQLWNDASGSQIAIRGGLTDDGMLLEGQIHYLGNNGTFPFRGLWTPLPDGRVRQFFEQSNDSGATWVPWFEGFYSRREAHNSQ